MGFFTDAFLNMSDEAKESFYRTVILNDPSEEAGQLRLQYYKSVLKHMGENVKIGTGVKIENPQYVSIGDNVLIRNDVTIIARGSGGVEIGEGAYIMDRVLLDSVRPEEGYIHIGPHTYIGVGTTLFGHVGLEIGDNVLMAQNITLTPYSHIFEDPGTNIIEQGGHTRKVTIGRDAYIGMGVNIMYSGDIGEGSVIGAGSLVVKPIPPYSVAVGVPAKVIRKRG